MNFGQVDLVTEDVMLLDIGDSIFVWLGRDSNQVSQTFSFSGDRMKIRNAVRHRVGLITHDFRNAISRA